MTASEQRVVLVTGGSRGIGRACVLAFAQQGARVAFGFRSNAAASEEVVEAALAGGAPAALPLKADLRDPEAAAGLVAATVDRFGRLDVLVCNAGVFAGAPLLETTLDDYGWMFDVNTRAPFVLTQAAAKVMVDQPEGGAIVHILSAAMARAEVGNGLYRMTKGAQLMLVESAGYELAPFNVRVNAVAPGMTDTDMSRDDLEDPVRRRIVLQAVPAGRPASADEIAATVAFLGSDAASYVNGSVLWADGGRHLGPAA